jgi:alkaline phosphatase
MREIPRQRQRALSSAGGTRKFLSKNGETGEFAITGPDTSLPGPGTTPETAWTGNRHSAVETIIWSEGPGSENLARAMENTDVYQIMAEAMR